MTSIWRITTESSWEIGDRDQSKPRIDCKIVQCVPKWDFQIMEQFQEIRVMFRPVTGAQEPTQARIIALTTGINRREGWGWR
ncbi:hypothetical protein TNCV_2074841 [Trichonephila clavipes]|nr:hypothetical protein TNCV_2074841 [Trichonephila clavipes]